MKFSQRICTLIVLCLSCSFLLAQTNRGGISGTVVDKSGAVVPNAAIKIRNLGTNEVMQVKTSHKGGYTALSLDPVLYSVTVEAKGFKTAVVEQVKVDTAQTATVNVMLEIGAATTEVTVQADTAAVNLESGTTGTTISQRELTDIPLVNRSVLDLAVSQPNINGEAGSENPSIATVATVPGYNLSINGGRPGSSTFLSDGANNTGVSLARTMVSFSPETVQEFTVQTSNFSAEYGNSGGGIINVTTKSGTNQFTGTALWYVRNPYFDSPAWVSGPTTVKPPGSNLKYNQLSLTAGGPVVIPKLYHGQNKTFWFAAYEPRYRSDLCTNCSNSYSLLPTDAMRAGDFSNTTMVRNPNGSIVRVPNAVAQQFGFTPGAADANIYNHYKTGPGSTNQFALSCVPSSTVTCTYPQFAANNIIPASMLDATALKALAYIPHAGAYFLDPGGNIANLFNPRTLRQNETRYTVRVDHIFSDSNKINGRYTHQPTVKTQFTPDDPTGAGAEYSYSKQAMIAYTHLFTPSLFNDLRLNYTRGRFSTTIGQQFDVNTGQNLNTILGLPSLTHGGVPSLPFMGGQASNTQDDTEERYGITDIVYMTRGEMSWKFGVDLSHSLQNETPLFDAIGGNYDIRALQTNSNGGNSGTGGDFFASFLLGVANGVNFRPAVLRYHYKWNALAAFVQDDWKVLPRLTLNLGLRYNLELPRTEDNNLQGVFRPDLAQSFPVTNPTSGLLNVGGYQITSVMVPPYAFAGKGGRSRYLYPPSYLNFEPRFGFAWSPEFLSLHGHQMTIRGGYGLYHLPVSGTNRLPDPDFGFVQNFINSVNLGPDPQNNPWTMRLGENPPIVTPVDVNQAVFKNIPANGLLYLQPNGFSSLAMPGFAISTNRHAPYTQAWNLTLSWEATRRTIVEVSYQGSKGTHLFEGGEDINPRNFNFVNTLEQNNINTTSTSSGNGVPDPLGRKDANGNLIRIQIGTLLSPFAGFPALFSNYDAAGNSIRHAGYVYVRERIGKGLFITSNYTYGKSIDDSQGASDRFVLSTGQVAGQAAFGAPRGFDRSVSAFDQKHSFNATFIYDLPFGRGQKLLSNAWAPVNALLGGWTTTGIFRLTSGYPARATMADSNLLGDPTFTHQIRPNVVPGVPLKNPLWSSSCPQGGQCQPFLNPEAFERPPLGQFGNAPRTFDGVRGPMEQFFDASVQKTFSLGGDGKRKLQVRMDMLNAFNHPVFRMGPDNNFTDFTSNASPPNAGRMNAADYNLWATANGQPTVTSVNGTTGVCSGPGANVCNQIQTMVNQFRNGSGILPADFFTMQLPANFHTTQATSFDIRTLTGYKLWRLRNVYNNGFGTLHQNGTARYVQFGVKVFF